MSRTRKAAATQEVHNVHPQLVSLLVPVGLLTLDPENAREHSESNIETIKTSLKEFSQRKPIVVRKDGMVVTAGNGTLTAAKALGWTHIAALICEDDEEEAKAWALVDNRSAELATWNYERLVQDFVSLRETRFDPSTLGWDQRELDMLTKSSFVPDAVEDMPGRPESAKDGDSNGSEPNIDKTSMKSLRVAYYKHAKEQETIGQFLVRAVNELTSDD